MTKELKPTYGDFALRGKVTWIERPKAFREDTGSSGYTYRGLSFGVKTADDNIVAVDMFQTKFDEVQLQNIETKKRDKKVSYGEHDVEDLPDGYRLFMPVNVGLEKDDKGDNIKKQLIQYDAIKYIKDNLKNDQSVFIFGSNRFSEYEKDGNTTLQHQFEPRGIYLTSDAYEDEKFTSQATFKQTIVLRKTEKKENRLIVDAYIITDKKGNFVPHRFYVDITKYKTFAMNLHKLKFGSILNVEGIIRHTVTQKQVETKDNGWGESPEPKTNETVKKELEITKAEKPKKDDEEYYSKVDFTKKVEKKQEDNPFDEKEGSDNDWGSSPTEEDIFEEDEEDPFA